MPVVPEERPEGCVWRVLSGAGVGYGLGTVLGAISANWSDLPAVIRDQPWPALKRTGSLCSSCSDGPPIYRVPVIAKILALGP